jgi:hypothetical protein
VFQREDEERVVRVEGCPRFERLIHWLGNVPWQWWVSTSMLVMMVYVHVGLECVMARDCAMV